MFGFNAKVASAEDLQKYFSGKTLILPIHGTHLNMIDPLKVIQNIYNILDDSHLFCVPNAEAELQLYLIPATFSFLFDF